MITNLSVPRIGETTIGKYFNQKFIDALNVLLKDGQSKNHDRIEMISEFVKNNTELVYLGAGTNRIAFRTPEADKVIKIALDYQGCIDNKSEYLISQYEKNYKNLELLEDRHELYPFLADTFELHDEGLLLVAEYCRAVPPEIFESKDFKKELRSILKIISKEYLFEDMGYLKKNMLNFGLDVNDSSLKIIDYAYMKPLELIDLDCPFCKIGTVHYNKDYSKLVCRNTGCEEEYAPFEIMSVESMYTATPRSTYGTYSDDDDDINDLIGDMSDFYDDDDIEKMTLQEAFENRIGLYRMYQFFVRL